MKKHWAEIATSWPAGCLVLVVGALLITLAIQQDTGRRHVDPGNLCRTSALRHMSDELGLLIAIRSEGYGWEEGREAKLVSLRKAIAEMQAKGCGL